MRSGGRQQRPTGENTEQHRDYGTMAGCPPCTQGVLLLDPEAPFAALISEALAGTRSLLGWGSATSGLAMTTYEYS